MGWLSKAWKGVKKVFKKIGKGIKKVAMKVGKFMNKIGIVGQIAMMFILPAIGNFLLSGLGGAATSMIANTFGGIAGAVVKGAGYVLQAAHKFVTVGKNIFNTVAEGVSGFVAEFGKTALNKIPGINIQSASKNFFGTGGAWETVQKDIVKNASNIFNPFKSTIKMTEGMSLDDLVNSSGVSKARIQEMNISLDLDNLKVGQNINFDAGISPYRYGAHADFAAAARGGTESLQQYMGNAPDMLPGTSRRPKWGSGLGERPLPTTMKGYQEALRSEALLGTGGYQELINATPSGYLDTLRLGTPTQSLLADPVAGAGQVVADTVKPEGFLQEAWQAGKDEFKTVYGDPFQKAPVGTTLRALGDIQDVQEQFSVQELGDEGYQYAPMYVGTSSQDYDVRAAGQPRNFAAYSSGGQYGSMARIYDTITMNPISTWSRDLASRTI